MTNHLSRAGAPVPAGKDRFGQDQQSIWGLVPVSTKLSARDSNGAVYIFEHTDMGKGGPPRHLHFAQDEWFYVLKGDFAFEVGDRRYRLGPGDSLYAPRQIPHVWAHLGPGLGSILIALTPAGQFEDFVQETARLASVPPPDQLQKSFLDHGMEVVGPPLEV